jgi:long-chain fatty acid transport protein
VVPGGLSKRWEGAVGKTTAEEFTLETIEINPTAAFEVSPELALAVGFRIVHSSGVAKATPLTGVVYQDMTGDSLDFGYNLALAYQPIKELEIGATYRSKINLTLDGDANLAYPGNGSTIPALVAGNYDGSVDLPLPAALNLAVAYTFASKTTLEFVYERTMWSEYNKLDFNYVNPLAEAIFGRTKEKNWKDTNTFRLGAMQEIGDFCVMAGLVFDETPVPDETISYELPDSDSVAVSLGGSYSINDKWDLYLAGLYSMHDDRDATIDGVSGEFSNSDVLILSAGFGFKF